MAKACRTCGSASRVLKCAYGWPCYEGPVVCEDHEPRETPLLVDELAKACDQAIIYLRWLPTYNHKAGFDADRQAVLVDLRKAKARYQEEVNDVKT